LLKHYNENQPLLSSRPSCHRVRRTWFVVPRKSPVPGAVSLKLPPIIGNATYRIFFGFVGHAHAALSFTLSRWQRSYSRDRGQTSQRPSPRSNLGTDGYFPLYSKATSRAQPLDFCLDDRLARPISGPQRPELSGSHRCPPLLINRLTCSLGIAEREDLATVRRPSLNVLLSSFPWTVSTGSESTFHCALNHLPSTNPAAACLAQAPCGRSGSGWPRLAAVGRTLTR
jgi:hypothetical protein